MEGMGEGRECMVINDFCRLNARRVRLARALRERQRAPERQPLRTLTVIHV
jgi:hypothetical protein